MAEWTDAKKRDQYTKVCEALGLIDYPDGRAPYLAYPSEVIAAIRRLVDEEVSGWNELTEGCRMPEPDEWVNVTCETEPYTFADGHTQTYGPEIRLLKFCVEPNPEEHAAGDHFHDGNDYWPKRDGRYRSYRSYLTAWMPAPKPFVKGQA